MGNALSRPVKKPSGSFPESMNTGSSDRAVPLARNFSRGSFRFAGHACTKQHESWVFTQIAAGMK